MIDRRKLEEWKSRRFPALKRFFENVDTLEGYPDDDVDPLEKYMVQVTNEVEKISAEDTIRMASMEPAPVPEIVDECEPIDVLQIAEKKINKKKDVVAIAHDTIDYLPFRKNFYIEPPELSKLTVDNVRDIRLDLDGIRVVGKDCPKPSRKWTHCGLSSSSLEIVKLLKFNVPTPVQAQAIPAVMSGRDVIAVAKTGSGKTLAFVLPLLRHIKDQPPLREGEGPVAVIMTPTRELADQINKVCRTFGKPLNLTCVCCYGGSPISEQIAELKRGTEIVVGTPGRIIDLLCANGGRVTNLQRVTYLVLDEADRMFDMGFEPQVMRIVQNVRPDRQTVLFSATFSRTMETLARRILKCPIEITVGHKSAVASNVTQYVEVVPENEKFARLLQVLGVYFNADVDHRALIFVDRQESSDFLMSDLIERGYVCNSLHGGKDQMDRDSTITDFKAGNFDILIATSIASRGLDVLSLGLVINYDCPNHKEDYIHRVGRTGRAGNRGIAYTFVQPDQEKYAPVICEALRKSRVAIPEKLAELAKKFKEKVKLGKETPVGRGFGGNGLEKLDQERANLITVQKIQHGVVDFDTDEEESIIPVTMKSALSARANDLISQFNLQLKNPSVGANEIVANSNGTYTCEFEINQYPQRARWRVTNKDQISQISELTGAAITTRGSYVYPGKKPPENERPLYLFIEGDSQISVEKAKGEVARMLKEAILAGPDETVIRQGDRKTFPGEGDTVRMHYDAYLPDGTKIDSSRDRGSAQVIRGFDEASKQLSLGQISRLEISSDFAYGVRGVGNLIPPNTDLFFDVEILKINE